MLPTTILHTLPGIRFIPNSNSVNIVVVYFNVAKLIILTCGQTALNTQQQCSSASKAEKDEATPG